MNLKKWMIQIRRRKNKGKKNQLKKVINTKMFKKMNKKLKKKNKLKRNNNKLRKNNNKNNKKNNKMKNNNNKKIIMRLLKRVK